ncbi:diguanylate cyclase [Hydrocarboniclastica marina]|uniref:Diguanylate cyclase n=2 Tax=Hydrocarboniclastica marina TaxID=2259620 RepID=A0A4P7XG22_9ALTE|nr:diguanylate cyclase [Hydrocarboniclastica marina]
MNCLMGLSRDILSNFSILRIKILLPKIADGTGATMTEALALDKKRVGLYPQAQLLVVDDDPKLLASLSPLLENKGFHVDTVQDGRSACRQTQARDYDLILLDMVMPGMSGLQVLSWLGKAGFDVPVVVISGTSAFNTVRRALRKGAFDYITKPYCIERLVATIGEALEKQKRERARAALQLYSRSSDDFYRRAIDTLPDITFALDRHGRFVFLNRKIEELLGYSRDELIGKNFRCLIEDAEIAGTLATSQGFGMTAYPVTQELPLKSRSNTSRHLEVTVLPITGEPLWSPVQLVCGGEVQVFGIARDITERKKAETAAEYRASHDSLTGLPNRTLFTDRLNLGITHARRNNQKLAVMFLDLNRFKAVNDNYGHGVGDQLLRDVTERLKACLREGDTLSRFGGDEFTLLLPAVTTTEDARTIGAKLVRALREPFAIDEHDTAISIGISIGVALFPDAGETADQLVERADVAMYNVKRRGDDDYEFFV